MDHARFLDSFQHLVHHVPAPYLAAAVAKLMPEFIKLNERVAHTALEEMFIECKPALVRALMGNSRSKLAVATCFLEEYFNSKGDWDRMRRELVNNGNRMLAPHGITYVPVVDQLAKALLETIREIESRAQ